MPLPTQYIRATVVYHSNDIGGFQMIFWFIHAGADFPIDQGYAANIANAVDASQGFNLRQQMASSAVYDGTLISVNDNGRVFTAYSTGSAGIGGVGGDSCPDFVCAVLRKRANVPGRRGIGRWRMSCLPESYTTDNRLNGAGIGALVPLVANLWAHLIVGADTWVSAHHSQRNVTLLPIVDGTVDSKLGRMKRRTLKSLI